MRVLVDSDVVIAAMAANEDQSADSAALMDALSAGQFTGLTTPVIMANIMFVLGNKWRISRKQQDRARVVKAMTSLIPMFNMVEVAPADFYASFASEFADLEDGLQHFAVLHAGGVDAIITCNTADFEGGQLPVFEPGEFLREHLAG